MIRYKSLLESLPVAAGQSPEGTDAQQGQMQQGSPVPNFLPVKPDKTTQKAMGAIAVERSKIAAAQDHISLAKAQQGMLRANQVQAQIQQKQDNVTQHDVNMKTLALNHSADKIIKSGEYAQSDSAKHAMEIIKHKLNFHQSRLGTNNK